MSTKNRVCVCSETPEGLQITKDFNSVKDAYTAIGGGDLGEGPFTVATIWAEGVTLKAKPVEYGLEFKSRFGGGRGRAAKATKGATDAGA